jgi:serine protease AprX
MSARNPRPLGPRIAIPRQTTRVGLTPVFALAGLLLLPQIQGRPVGAARGSLPASVRVLDDLADRLRDLPAGSPLEVILTFDRPLERLDPAIMPWSRDPACLYRVFPAARAVACRLSPEQVEAVARAGVVVQLEADVAVYATREASNLAFGVASARADFGLSGDGDGDPNGYTARDATVAILDTGIDAAHQDFAGGKVIGWRDVVAGRSEPYDDNGHGTHLASIAAGRRVGDAGGVAPGAALVGVKVLRRNGAGRLSDIAAGLQYCIDERERLGIRVINISLGSDRPSDGADLGSRMVNEAVAAGIVVVVAAGNTGPVTRTIGSPSAAERAITVGSMADPARGGFALSAFSSRGPTADGRVKPDLCAPGEAILAARAGSVSGYRRFSGTSMSAPFVAGVAALMVGADPTLTPGDVKGILMETAVDFGAPGPDIDYGAGRLDARAAIGAVLETAAASVDGPAHAAARGTLADQGIWQRSVRVTSTEFPVAATLLITGGSRAGADFDLRLLDPSGRVIAESATDERQEALRVLPRQTGIYTLEVISRTGAGGFTIDLSGGLELLSPAN